jgi:orotidine-5'-phosphate decarboxylase
VTAAHADAARARLLVALDVADRARALALADGLAGRVGGFKVGLELFVREGPPLVEEIRGRGGKVFLDLKLHDIPNTVRSAVRSASSLGVDMLTVHAAGGRAMLEAAREAAEAAASPPLLVAVTALTSLGRGDVAALWISEPVEAWVDRLADLAWAARIPGLVASAREAAGLRARYPGTRLVVPGIRPAGGPVHDQARAATPAEAIRAGADFLVVGRAILDAEDPARAADAIVAEIGGAFEVK